MNDRIADALRLTLSTDGWKKYIVPILEQRCFLDMNLLANTALERPKEAVSDDFLRGRIFGVRAVLTEIPAHLTDFDKNQANMAEQSKVAADADAPVGGPYTPVEPS